MTDDMRTARDGDQAADCRSYKRCGHCGKDKPLTTRYFSHRTEHTQAHQWRSKCNQCVNERKRELREQAKARTHKVCTTCPETGPQPVENFYLRRGSVDGRQAQCKACEAIRAGSRRSELGMGAEKPNGRKKLGCQCEGMSWRVIGPRCSCGMTYAEEPKPELETRRFYDLRAHG